MNSTKITWLGHSSFLLETSRGTNLLIDPFLSGNPAYPAGTLLPEKIDAILLTHAHGDHTGDVLPLAMSHACTVVAIHELATYFAAKGVANTIGMNLGGTVQISEVAATMVEARHSSSIPDETGNLYGGSAAGFVLTIEDGTTIYHAGDTTVFGDMALIRELYQPRIAILPIGGHYTMGPREAAVAVRLLQPEIVLPIHFGTFPPLKGTPVDLKALVDPAVEVLDWKPGACYQA